MPEESIEGVVERVVHVNSAGFTVVRMAVADEEVMKASGKALLGVQPGETLRLTGTRRQHAVYGEEFAVTGCEYIAPATLYAIRRYLSSGLVRGIGPKLAEAIVGEFCVETLRVVDETPERLLEVHLIGRTRYADIVDAWHRHQDVRELMILLQSAGVSPSLAPKVAEYFRQELPDGVDCASVVETVREKPYRLTEVRGLGFRLADKVALSLGWPEVGAERLQAGLIFALDDVGGSGDCFLAERELLTHSRALLGVEEDLLVPQLNALRAAERVVVQLLPYKGGQVPGVFSRRMFSIETQVTAHVARLHRAHTRLAVAADWRDGPLPKGAEVSGLTRQQEWAVRMAMACPVAVLTGGPGCGKSYTVKAVVSVAEALGVQVALAAPTGRAARRLSELTGMVATTVHRLIRPPRHTAGGATLFDHRDPLETGLFIIDEASMLDVQLFERLLEKIPTGAHLLLVGDVDQLPSVGPGRVLADLLAVKAIPRVQLTEVFRQKRQSAIVRAAHDINQGKLPVSRGEFWFIPEENPEKLAETVVDIATRRLPARFNTSPGEVQVLCPNRGRTAGSVELARAIQDIVNPVADGDVQHWADGRPFRLGDRVMATRNDMRKGPAGVLNGTGALITAIDTGLREVTLLLDDGDEAVYGFDELDDLVHAYAVTVHRSQGSEYSYVVVPLSLSGGGLMLRRNLLYTAVTRAKKMLVLVGERDALKQAVEWRARLRKTALGPRLSDALNGTRLLSDPLRPADGQIALP
ncbi:ATP-dependent RecD-like DNA helicase [Kitasatospora sp. NPDC059747]|uniref:SF1B family DNA helicase RecD2 n=1 Tax=Kitasatospora sp. NPDC059747 TaxID=3346930 RepID=UPI00365158F3